MPAPDYPRFYHYGPYVLDFLHEIYADPPGRVLGEGWMCYNLKGTNFIMVRYGVDVFNPKRIRWYKVFNLNWVYETLDESCAVDFDEVFDSIPDDLKIKMIPHLELLSR